MLLFGFYVRFDIKHVYDIIVVMQKKYKSEFSFKKRDYVRILNNVIDCCLRRFGYSIRPYVRETNLRYGEMMMFIDRGHRYAILYDYQQFRRMFGKYNYEVQQAYTILMAAHEMRHYYQIRQIFSKTPREDEKTIAEWCENHFNGKYYENYAEEILDFYMQPMELDAELYAYWFVCKVLDKGVKLDFIDENFIQILKSKWIEKYGEDDEDLYIFDFVE